MTELFFYGTLRFAPLLERVLGRDLATIDLTPASLGGHAVYEVKDQVFPVIIEEPEAQAEGVLVRGLSEEDIQRLVFYEGGFAYDLESRNLRLPNGSQQNAQIFFPEPGRWSRGTRWSLQQWVDQWGEMTLYAAEEVMAYFGRATSEEIDRNFGAIRMRAWAQVAAKKRRTGDLRDVSRDVVLHRRNYPYFEYFGMQEVLLQHRQHDGTLGPVISRNSLMTGQAAVVLPYDPIRDTVLLIEQFRAPVYMIGDPEPWVWEPVAGMIDPGETPEETALREALEEAHVALDRLEYAGGAYSSTGSSTEYAHLFVGLTDLTKTADNGGLASEGEDIRSRILPFKELIEMVDSHRVKNLQLLTLAHWLFRNRERLREVN